MPKLPNWIQNCRHWQILLLFCCDHLNYHCAWRHLAACVCCSPLYHRVQADICLGAQMLDLAVQLPQTFVHAYVFATSAIRVVTAPCPLKKASSDCPDGLIMSSYFLLDHAWLLAAPKHVSQRSINSAERAACVNSYWLLRYVWHM